MNPSERIDYDVLKKLANKRIREAKILLDMKHPSGAYYLAGYAIELGFKAYYCKQRMFPPRKTEDLYKHDPSILLQSCGLKELLDKDCKKDQELNSAWGVIKDWSEESRYKITRTDKAKDFIDAINNPKYGVLTWLMKKI